MESLVDGWLGLCVFSSRSFSQYKPQTDPPIVANKAPALSPNTIGSSVLVVYGNIYDDPSHVAPIYATSYTPRDTSAWSTPTHIKEEEVFGTFVINDLSAVVVNYLGKTGAAYEHR